jgi:hypothetical protein
MYDFAKSATLTAFRELPLRKWEKRGTGEKIWSLPGLYNCAFDGTSRKLLLSID